MKNTIISPIVTEKSIESAKTGKYSFIVDKSASKTVIKEAIGSLFKVNVIKIQTSIIKGRKKRIGSRRTEITQPELKKTIVELKKGEKIGLFEPGSTAEETALSEKAKEEAKKEKKRTKAK